MIFWLLKKAWCPVVSKNLYITKQYFLDKLCIWFSIVPYSPSFIPTSLGFSVSFFYKYLSNLACPLASWSLLTSLTRSFLSNVIFKYHPHTDGFYLFVLAALGVCCGVRGLLSSCAVQTSHCSGVSGCIAQALGCVCFTNWGAWALEPVGLSTCSSRAQLQRVASSLTGDWTHDPCRCQEASQPLDHKGSPWLLYFYPNSWLLPEIQMHICYLEFWLECLVDISNLKWKHNSWFSSPNVCL